MPLIPGARLGPYEIVAPIGAGGMGEVFRARDSRLDRMVAIKVLPQALAADPQLRARFEREARTISSLNHPYICTVRTPSKCADRRHPAVQRNEGWPTIPRQRAAAGGERAADGHRQLAGDDSEVGMALAVGTTLGGKRAIDDGLAELHPPHHLPCNDRVLVQFLRARRVVAGGGYTGCMTSELQATLREYRRLLESEFGARLRSMRLFGSQARGDASEESDADVSVVIAGLTEAERGRAIDLAYAAWRNAGAGGPLISPLPWSESDREDRLATERRIALDIEREGIPV
jgi:predicted nucleotidyltransferase